MLIASLVADIPPDTVPAEGTASSSWPVVVAIVAGVALALVIIGWVMRRKKANTPPAG